MKEAVNFIMERPNDKPAAAKRKQVKITPLGVKKTVKGKKKRTQAPTPSSDEITKNFSCQKCGQNFKSKSAVIMHNHWKHGNQSKSKVSGNQASSGSKETQEAKIDDDQISVAAAKEEAESSTQERDPEDTATDDRDSDDQVGFPASKAETEDSIPEVEKGPDDTEGQDDQETATESKDMAVDEDVKDDDPKASHAEGSSNTPRGRRGANRRLSYSLEFKVNVLTDLTVKKYRPTEVADMYGIHKSLVTKWQKQQKKIMQTATDQKKMLKIRRKKKKT